ncbi:MAG TPA: FAD-binding oxidoreductase [Acidimicrobiales bacterium]|nr:FAD-binding oxidoreductase [Acidimicrobiales bacterium]
MSTPPGRANPSAPTPVTAVDAAADEVTERLAGPRVPVDATLLERLRGACSEVTVDDTERMEAGRDWWPLAIRWATRGAVPSRPAAIARPSDAGQVAAVLRACHEAHVPVTPMAGRSGVCGSSIPAFGGVALDMCTLNGITDVDTTSLLAEVRPGTFGPDLEAGLRREDVTLGHWPQSMDLSTVGGWLACRGAGQYSTRYGKIEDMVVGLEVVLADGRLIRTGGTGPRAATGPDLTQLFVGSEGVLGVITSASLRLHPVAPAEKRLAYGFSSFAEGLEVCRRILRRGATPAVLRLYDHAESARNFDLADHCVLVVLDEADPGLLDATMDVVDAECAHGRGTPLGEDLVERWMSHRNDVSALAPLYRAGIVVDTIEISARWSALTPLYEQCVGALQAIDGTLAASAHQSHAYGDGACLYFTFAGRMPDDPSPTSGEASPAADHGAQDAWAERYYRSAWQTVMGSVIAHGGAISHHHGIGINRAGYMAPALGASLDVLTSVKEALDPRGILNPGKLGLPSPFGELGWP